ncbi:MAG: transcription antitermination factor NusB [Rhodospirillales bacterium]|nr:transcription antitermination factor NusB [Rhodospirillales bacterium]
MTEKKDDSARRTEIRPRSAARLAAVQAIYEMELAERSADAVLREFAERRWDLLAADRTAMESVSRLDPDTAFLGELVRGVAERNSDLEGMISPALSSEWPLERLEAVLRAILKAGAFELFARSDVPVRVVISEYVDIAHAFFEGKETGLVNAVLDRIGRVLRPDEIEGKIERKTEDNGDAPAKPSR